MNKQKGSSKTLVELLRVPGPLSLSIIRGRPRSKGGRKGKGRGQVPGAAAKSAFRPRAQPRSRSGRRSRETRKLIDRRALCGVCPRPRPMSSTRT